jgi:hypothetical protein
VGLDGELSESDEASKSEKEAFLGVRANTSNGLLYCKSTISVLVLWRFALGVKFQWVQIYPLEAPDMFSRYFYSARGASENRE